MTISRKACLLATAVGSLAAMAAAAASDVAPALSAPLPAISFIDLLLGAVGIVVTAMTALAGLLVIFDARMESAGARAWQDAAAGLTALVSAVAEASSESREKSASDARAEMLRRILIAHRFDRPQVVPQQMTSDEPRQDARKLDAKQSMQSVPPILTGVKASVTADEPRIGLPRDTADCALRLVASHAGRSMGNSTASKRQSAATWNESRRLVVNGGPSHFWHQPRAIVADELVATHGRRERNSPDQYQVSATDGTTTGQPTCRGPPRNSGQVAFREKHRPPTDALGEIVVVDNLGDRVPIGAAELDVIEAYLDDVLCDVLGGQRPDRGSDKT